MRWQRRQFKVKHRKSIDTKRKQSYEVFCEKQWAAYYELDPRLRAKEFKSKENFQHLIDWHWANWTTGPLCNFRAALRYMFAPAWDKAVHEVYRW